MEHFTRKIFGVTVFFLITFCIIVAGITLAFAEEWEFEKGAVMYITSGSCGVMPDGTLFKNDEERPKSTAQPCAVYQDLTNEDIRYVALADSKGNVIRILRLDRKTMEQKEVWKKKVDLAI